jgi:hypothetical protein
MELVTNLTSNETLVQVAVHVGGFEAKYISKRQEGENWVFLFEITSYSIDIIQANAGAGLAKFIGQNWKGIAAILAGFGIITIVWLWRDAVTAEPISAAKISENDTASIQKILDDPNMSTAEKKGLIEQVLAKSYTGSENGWQTTILYAALIFAAVYLLRGGMMK